MRGRHRPDHVTRARARPLEERSMRRMIGPLLALLAATGAYLYGFPAPTLIYGAGVVAHVVAGIGIALLLGLATGAFPRQPWPARIGWITLALATIAGLAIIVTGATLPYQPLVKIHI